MRLRGSSPRGRGKPRCTRPSLIPARLIPAWAGKTRPRPHPSQTFAAHPRVGGENVDHIHSRLHYAGSSPRGRGKHRRIPRLRWTGRLIPAWAGKTCRPGPQSRRPWAHPRVGGENLKVSALPPATAGSSPRGRGKPPDRWCFPLVYRLIPAWAGKTPSLSPRLSQDGAHPRVGGENPKHSHPGQQARGSSPRGRGKHGHVEDDTGQCRLIPAWAGKTWTRGNADAPRRAHPRVGGENRRQRRPQFRPSGSSPRGRGKRWRNHGYESLPRLIPAWAGKTSSCLWSAFARRAHPRVGGENTGDIENAVKDAGSSPRGRGKRRRPARDRRGMGLIPAWAGKTLLARP